MYREGKRQRKYSQKLSPKDELFMTLVKLKLNLKYLDLPLWFGVSISYVPHCVTTWICFLYYHFKEIVWMPAVNQVWGIIPSSFKEKIPTTFVIIDESEVFIERPSDLHIQSSMWSQYKHHNTLKFLVACTPNRAICYISLVYVGSISDIELTHDSCLLDALKDKPGIAIMADWSFTIKDMLAELNIELNMPSFLGQQQLSHKELESGRKIAALCIHVE